LRAQTGGHHHGHDHPAPSTAASRRCAIGVGALTGVPSVADLGSPASFQGLIHADVHGASTGTQVARMRDTTQRLAANGDQRARLSTWWGRLQCSCSCSPANRMALHPVPAATSEKRSCSHRHPFSPRRSGDQWPKRCHTVEKRF
jgi:hypothetical protein